MVRLTELEALHVASSAAPTKGPSTLVQVNTGSPAESWEETKRLARIVVAEAEDEEARGGPSRCPAESERMASRTRSSHEPRHPIPAPGRLAGASERPPGYLDTPEAS